MPSKLAYTSINPFRCFAVLPDLLNGTERTLNISSSVNSVLEASRVELGGAGPSVSSSSPLPFLWVDEGTGGADPSF